MLWKRSTLSTIRNLYRDQSRLWLLVVIVTMEIWMFNIHKYYYKTLHGLNSKGLKVAVDFAYAVHALCDK